MIISLLNSLLARFLIQSKPAPPRRDVHLHHVIIHEKADEKIAAHRVCLRSIALKLLPIFSSRSAIFHFHMSKPINLKISYNNH